MGEPRLIVVCRDPVMAVGLFGRRRLMSRVGLTVDDEPAFLEAVARRG
jgi:hypothetical protein